MILENEFATDVIACIAKKGICHSKKPHCRTCDHAKKYVASKYLFEFLRTCVYKDDIYCSKNIGTHNSICRGPDCLSKIQEADVAMKAEFLEVCE